MSKVVLGVEPGDHGGEGVTPALFGGRRRGRPTQLQRGEAFAQGSSDDSLIGRQAGRRDRGDADAGGWTTRTGQAA